MSNNKGGNFFKFRNVQIVRQPNPGRQTQQNTQINTEGTAEQQFENIQATARAEALIDINELLSDDDDNVDYSPPHETTQLQVQVQTPDSQTPDSEDTSISNATP